MASIPDQLMTRVPSRWDYCMEAFREPSMTSPFPAIGCADRNKTGLLARVPRGIWLSSVMTSGWRHGTVIDPACRTPLEI
jgi:hypothetical protein